jgi:hypothetical protein
MFDKNLYVEMKEGVTTLFCDGDEYKMRGDFSVEFGNFFNLFNEDKEEGPLVSRDEVVNICIEFYESISEYHLKD